MSNKRKSGDDDICDDEVVIVLTEKENVRPPKKQKEIKDLTESDDEEDDEPLIPTRFLVCNGPIVDGQKLVLKPNSRNVAQGDWSAIMYLKQSVVASNVQILKLVDEYAQTKMVDSAIYTPYRACDVTISKYSSAIYLSL